MQGLIAKADSEEYSENVIDDNILEHYREPSIEDNFENDKVNVILRDDFIGEVGFDNFMTIDGMPDLSSITYKLDTIYKGSEDKFNITADDKNPILVLELTKKDKLEVLSVIKKLSELEMVLVAEPNYIYDTVASFVPNDEYYSHQWGLNGENGINIEEVWGYTSGYNIKVGVMENGVDFNHEDLQGRIFPGNYSGSSSTEDKTHGTHVAGIIGAIKNNVGVAGISEARMYLLNRSSFVDSLEYASANGIKIINASFAFIVSETDHSYAPFNATHYAAISNYDGLLVCSAGNDNVNIDITPMYPASYDLPNVIAVGSLDSDGDRSSFSNYGTTVDIYAPGGRIYSTLPNNRYGYMSGTSMSAPHVTGVAALMLSSCDYITPEQLKTQLLNNADNITIQIPSSSGGTTTMGAKALNAEKAVATVDEYWTASRYMQFNYVEGAYNYSSSNFLASTDGHRIIKGIPLTVTAPSISGYTFQRWDVVRNNEGENITTTICSTSPTITISYEYLEDLIENGKYKAIDICAIYSSNCIAEGTLITLADGSQKAVEDLTGNENLLVWNLNTGTFDSAPILFIDREEKAQYEVIQLSFSDGTIVDVISEHGFWDVDLNEYVYLDEYAAEYIGHCFLKQGEDGMTAVTLVDVEVSTEETSAYSPVTYGHLCYYVNGLLSMPGGIDGLFNIFEVDKETMMYDAEAMAADIAQYGLYTYEEFNALYNVPEVMFDACGGQYLKVALGKGLITEEGLQNLIERYSVFFTE